MMSLEAETIGAQLSWEELSNLKKAVSYALPAATHGVLAIRDEKLRGLLDKLEDLSSRCAQNYANKQASDLGSFEGIVCEVCGKQAYCAVQDIDELVGLLERKFERHGDAHFFCRAHCRDSLTYKNGRLQTQPQCRGRCG